VHSPTSVLRDQTPIGWDLHDKGVIISDRVKFVPARMRRATLSSAYGGDTTTTRICGRRKLPSFLLPPRRVQTRDKSASPPKSHPNPDGDSPRWRSPISPHSLSSNRLAPRRSCEKWRGGRKISRRILLCAWNELGPRFRDSRVVVDAAATSPRDHFGGGRWRSWSLGPTHQC
jgi:hypothetical protein